MRKSNRRTLKNSCLLILGFVLISSCSSKVDKEASRRLVDISTPTGEKASLPYLVSGDDGFIYLSWIEKQDSGWTDFKYSRLEGDKWTDPELIASGNDWFVNWADYPMLAVDKEGNMIGHFLAKSSSGTYSYDVNVALKSVNGSWSEPLVPHSDGTPTEHGFLSMLPNNDGTFLLAWLDGRNTAGHEGHETHGTGAMTFRSAILKMNGDLSDEMELDNRVCDCCQTTGAMLDAGPVFIYRDRSEMEIRDIYITRKKDSLWLTGKPVYSDNWSIKGCPVNGPRASGFDNTLVTAWFTGAMNQPEVKVVFSSDGGESLSEPYLIDGTNPLGRVDVSMVDENRAFVSWLDQENDSTLIKFREVTTTGSLGTEMVVSQTKPSRSSGFPQMAKSGDSMFFAWTEINGQASSIRLRKISY